MSQSLEDQLDVVMNTRHQRRRQLEAARADAQKAIDEARAALDRAQSTFSTEIRGLIQTKIEQANRHLAARQEHWQFSEVSGYYTGPLYLGGSACNPIAYELRAEGKAVADPLLIELAQDGTIEAYLAPLPPSEPLARTTRIGFGWRGVPLESFNARSANDLVIRYLTAVSVRMPAILGGPR